MVYHASFGTAQYFVFETITSLIIIFSCFFVWNKTRELFTLSLQKGIKYFSNAFFVYMLAFLIKYIDSILNTFFGYGSVFIGYSSMFFGALGGFYLAYSLVWRHFEPDRIKRPHVGRDALFAIFALAITLVEAYLFINFGSSVPYIFYILMVGIIFSAIIVNSRDHKESRKVCDPFIASVVLSLGIYVALFIESLVFSHFPYVYYYAWGIIAVFAHAVQHNVARETK